MQQCPKCNQSVRRDSKGLQSAFDKGCEMSSHSVRFRKYLRATPFEFLIEPGPRTQSGSGQEFSGSLAKGRDASHFVESRKLRTCRSRIGTRRARIATTSSMCASFPDVKNAPLRSSCSIGVLQ